MQSKEKANLGFEELKQLQKIQSSIPIRYSTTTGQNYIIPKQKGKSLAIRTSDATSHSQPSLHSTIQRNKFVPFISQTL